MSLKKKIIIIIAASFFILSLPILYSLVMLGPLCLIPPCFDSSINIKKERRYLRELQAQEKTPRIFDGEVEPRMPDDEINDSTLEGIDANKNGIRDDVEIWINRIFENDSDKRKAFKQYAKAEQMLLVAGQSGDKKMVTEIRREVEDRAWQCISYFKEEHALDHDNSCVQKRRDVPAFVFGSTRSREKAFMKAENLVDLSKESTYQSKKTLDACLFNIIRKFEDGK